MEIELKRTIPEKDLKEAFSKLGIEEEFYPVFKERALYRLNDIAYSREPEEYDYEDSIELASEYIKEYAVQIKKGKSKVYSHAYAYAVNMEYQEVYCTIFAEAYEVAIEHGQDKSEAFCLGDFCTEASDQGYWLYIKDFIKRFHEDWQKNFYIGLVRRDYEQEHHSPMPEGDLELLRRKLFHDER